MNIAIRRNNSQKALMKKIIFIALSALMAGSAVSQTTALIDQAEVLSVRALSEQVNRPVETCWYETQELVSQEKSPTGAIVGAIAGGILGRQVGGGTGRDIATGVGVIGGALIGDNLANERGGAPKEIKRCRKEDRWVSVEAGYEVRYRYANQILTAVLPYNPGRTIELDVKIAPIVR